MEIKSYKDLNVWKKAFDFSLEIYKVTSAFLSEERFGMTSRIRRAAVSIPANIAEGWSRKSTKSYIQFLNIAMGSAAEAETLLEISAQLKYLTVEVNENLQKILMEIGRMFKCFDQFFKAGSSYRFLIPNS